MNDKRKFGLACYAMYGNWKTAQALRNAGWTPKEIAEEMEIDEQGVIDHTTPPAPKKRYALEWTDINSEDYMRGNELI